MGFKRLLAGLMIVLICINGTLMVTATDSEFDGALEPAKEEPKLLLLPKINDHIENERDFTIRIKFEKAREKKVVEPEVVVEEPKPASSMHLWGVCTITHYCWCAQCCGRAGHPTASGVNPTVNHTVACGSLPFGTRLMINGQEYVVEDRGVDGFWVDIFVGSHDEANARGMFQAEVYIID